MRRCPQCGQAVPEDGIPEVGMTRGQRLIYQLVKRAGARGIVSTELFDKVYGDDPDGGPTSGMVSLRTRIWYLNRRLGRIGEEIRAVGWSGGPRGGTQMNNPGHYILRKLAKRRK